MKKKYRVKSAKDFQGVIDNGIKIYSKEYIIYYLNTNTGYCRVGISVGKKMLKRAVDRNYEKRVLRSIFSNVYSRLQGSYDIVIFSRKKSLELKYEQRVDKICELLVGAKLLMEDTNEINK